MTDMTEALYISRWWLKRNKDVAIAQWSELELAHMIEIIYNLGKHDMMLNDLMVEYLLNQKRKR